MIHQMGQLRASQRVEVLSGKCCAVRRGTVYRYSTCVSDSRWVSLTLTQPVGQSVNHSVSQAVTCSVCQFGSSHARKQLPSKWVCCCCCWSVVCVLHFMTVIHFCPPAAVICGFLPAWRCLAKSYWIVIAATCDKSMTRKVDKWSTETERQREREGREG